MAHPFLYKMNIHENYTRKRKDAKVTHSRLNKTHFFNTSNHWNFKLKALATGLRPPRYYQKPTKLQTAIST